MVLLKITKLDLLMYMRVQSDQAQRIGVGCGGDEGVKVKVMKG